MKGQERRRANIKLNKEYFEKLDRQLELIPLSYDKAFKSTFKSNLNILKNILNVSLPIIISDEDKISILDSEMPIINKKEHAQIVDIFVVINNTIYIDIEMNRSKFENVFERNTEYKNRMSNIIFEKGESLKELKTKRLYQLNLNASPNEKILEDTIVMYGLTTKKIYSSNESTIVKSLERYRELYYNGVKDEEVLWFTMLTARSFSELYELASQILDEKELKRLMEASINMSKDGFVLHAWQKEKMDALVKYNEIKEATDKGKAEGIKENTIEIAKNLLKENVDVETISKATGLTAENIQKLSEKGSV